MARRIRGVGRLAVSELSVFGPGIPLPFLKTVELWSLWVYLLILIILENKSKIKNIY